MSAATKKQKNKSNGHPTTFSEFDISLLREGKHYMLYKHLGAQPLHSNGKDGIHFSVWAPNALKVSVIGDFNNWDGASHVMDPRWDSSGIWELFVPDIAEDTLYKFQIRQSDNTLTDKADPFAFRAELPPHTASVVPSGEAFKWGDKKWQAKKQKADILAQPLSIYEMHLGSWRRVPEESNRFMTYREVAGYLPSYCKEMGFTHVEFMPLMEHPFYGSWGYQITGYYAVSSRFGAINDFKYLIDSLHKEGIGVILDWVPSHFPGDAHGLYKFDGTHLYEHSDPQQGYHPDWSSYIFNYGRNEVRAFLISNAIFWLEEFHIDGLRVDAVASMLYRDYSRKHGEWTPNHLGGRENLEAILFLQELNEAVHTLAPGAFTIAEESTAFPGVTAPVSDGGLGFDLKWMMGWMHDTLEYFKKDPIYRSFHQHQLTFSMQYAFSEKFVLPLSHDEVVHGKGSLFQKMPGDEWQKAANLRLLYAYMWAHPGGKLLFMGGEFGQHHEWQHDCSLDWHETEGSFHSGLQLLIKDLNRLYNKENAWFQKNYAHDGFEWIDTQDTQNSVFSWLRKGADENDYLVFIMNATPRPLHEYRIGIHKPFKLTEILNTDNRAYGGSNMANHNLIEPSDMPLHNRPYAIHMTLPPLGLIVLKPQL